MRYYIATSLSRAEEHNKLRDILNELGHELTYDWTVHGNVRNESSSDIAEVAEAEVNAVADAHVVIVLLPGGRGTHTELGVALGREIRVIIVGDIELGFFSSDDRTCAFYHHGLCEWVYTIGEAATKMGRL